MFAVLKSLVKNVTTAGTALPLSSTKVLAYGLKIKGRPGNTGVVAIGPSTVLAANGYQLAASQEWVVPEALAGPLREAPVDLSQVYVDAAVNGEGVCVSYFEENLG